MDKREAKREACDRAASVIETALAGGWEVLDKYGEDRPKVENALNELVAELEARAAGRPRKVET